MRCGRTAPSPPPHTHPGGRVSVLPVARHGGPHLPRVGLEHVPRVRALRKGRHGRLPGKGARSVRACVRAAAGAGPLLPDLQLQLLTHRLKPSACHWPSRWSPGTLCLPLGHSTHASCALPCPSAPPPPTHPPASPPPTTPPHLGVRPRPVGSPRHRPCARPRRRRRRAPPSRHQVLNTVNRVPPGAGNKMESFWIAETLKYFYLLFSDDVLEVSQRRARQLPGGLRDAGGCWQRGRQGRRASVATGAQLVGVLHRLGLHTAYLSCPHMWLHVSQLFLGDALEMRRGQQVVPGWPQLPAASRGLQLAVPFNVCLHAGRRCRATLPAVGAVGRASAAPAH